MVLIKPVHLKKGDKVGIVSPSWSGAGRFPHRLKRGIELLRKLGLNPVTGSCAISIKGNVAGYPEERARDINRMFANKQIKAIFTTIGGVYCNEVLPFIDFNLIRKNPKIFMGYSDITPLLLSIYRQSGLVTFYGPMVMTQMAEYPCALKYTLKHFKKALFSPLPMEFIQPSVRQVAEWREWRNKEDLARSRKYRRGFWKWLKEGKSRGRLMGGCLNALLRLKGTRFFPDFDQAILFWEIPEGVKPEYVDIMLMDLDLTGLFSQISGMIIGRPSQYFREDLKVFERIVLKRTKNYNFPILTNTEIGHTDPVLTIPLGAMAELDSQANNFCIKESGVR